MKVEFLQNQTIDAIEAHMNRLAQRQQIVISNLANIDTPGYKSKDISFHATMQELLGGEAASLQTSRSEHSAGMPRSIPTAQAFEVQGLTSREDQNNVDLDRELTKMGETSFGYSMMTQFLRGKFRTLAMSINEGRG
jgi:flagellar basal-body rod protein FlgB